MEAVASGMKSSVHRVTGAFASNDLFPTLLLALATIVVLYLLLMSPRDYAGETRDAGLYGLEHGRLNIVAKPTTMWMNIGFWENTTDFPTACRDLLIEVLEQAGLVQRYQDGIQLAPQVEHTNILDLGFGCGDQTLCLAGIWQGTPLNYVGLTLNQTQYRCANERLAEANIWNAKTMKVHCANAARPETWNKKIMTEILSLKVSTSRDQARGGQDDVAASLTWVLALDTLYHFTPSRLPVLKFAARELRASLMAFDFLRGDTTSMYQRLLLKLVALLSGCSGSAFMTEDEYRRMLVQAGYGSDIKIIDVTKDTLEPLSNFLSKQEADLKRIGLSLGKLKAGKWLFTWFARSNVVKAVIVVARYPKAES